jgi:outer membrane protein assembly factor BamB
MLPRRWVMNLALLHVLALVGMEAARADWPQWRGPNRDGKSADTGLLQTWPEAGPQRVWLFKNCGAGYGSPAVVGDRLYILGTRNDQEVLLALDATSGEELWQAPIGDIYEESHGDGPRGTPAVAGDMVFALGADGNLIGSRTDSGEVVWTVSMQDLGGERPHWGYSESPWVYKDTVLCTPGGEKGAIAAIDAKTGEVVWQSKEITSLAHYASIVPMNHDGHDEAVQLLPDQVVGFDPASGKLLWSAPWPKPVAAIPTPVVSEPFVYVTSGYGVGCMLVEVDDDHQAEKVYDNKIMKNKQGGVILIDDHLFGHSDGAGWLCQDLKTGATAWRDRDAMGMGSIAFADGRFYCLDEDEGEIALVEPSTEEWKEHGRFKLEPQSETRPGEGRVWTHPVVTGGMLFLRDQELVYCYDVRDAGLASSGGE